VWQLEVHYNVAGLGRRETADPSASLLMTRGGVLSFALVAGEENSRSLRFASAGMTILLLPSHSLRIKRTAGICSSSTLSQALGQGRSWAQRKPRVAARSKLGAIRRYFPCSESRHAFIVRALKLDAEHPEDKVGRGNHDHARLHAAPGSNAALSMRRTPASLKEKLVAATESFIAIALQASSTT
jgi:hypothetical protein